ncbi:hypothetical protein BS17DRAFT_820387, partial [Gyrodon lividus]
MSDFFELCFWVRGQRANRVALIDISRTATVGTLQKLLKGSEENTFRAVDASALQLYKPRDPVPEPYDENLSSVILSELGEPLSPSHELSEVFTAPPPKRHIHIIVG